MKIKFAFTLSVILGTTLLSGCGTPYVPIVHNNDSSGTVNVNNLGYIRDPRTGNCFAATSTTAEPGGKFAVDTEGLTLATVGCTDAVLNLVPRSEGGNAPDPLPVHQ